MEQLALEEYLEEIRRLEEKIGRLDKKIEVSPSLHSPHSGVAPLRSGLLH
jgi:hypothetical protein